MCSIDSLLCNVLTRLRRESGWRGYCMDEMTRGLHDWRGATSQSRRFDYRRSDDVALKTAIRVLDCSLYDMLWYITVWGLLAGLDSIGRPGVMGFRLVVSMEDAVGWCVEIPAVLLMWCSSPWLFDWDVCHWRGYRHGLGQCGFIPGTRDVIISNRRVYSFSLHAIPRREVSTKGNLSRKQHQAILCR